MEKGMAPLYSGVQMVVGVEWGVLSWIFLYKSAWRELGAHMAGAQLDDSLVKPSGAFRFQSNSMGFHAWEHITHTHRGSAF